MYDPQLVIKQELQKGEKLLWSAQPKQGFFINKSDLPTIIFGVVWTCFALFWEYQVLQQDNPGVLLLFGIPFITIGFHMTIGKYLLDTKRREKTFYGITNERVIILQGLFSKHTSFFELKKLNNIILQKKQGYGSILLIPEGSSNKVFSKYNRQQKVPRLANIDDVKIVYSLLKSLISEDEA